MQPRRPPDALGPRHTTGLRQQERRVCTPTHGHVCLAWCRVRRRCSLAKDYAVREGILTFVSWQACVSTLALALPSRYRYAVFVAGLSGSDDLVDIAVWTAKVIPADAALVLNCANEDATSLS